MDIKAVLIGLWVLLGAGYWYIASTYCDSSADILPQTVSTDSPFYFNHGESDLVRTENFSQYRNGIVTSEEGDTYVIEGLMTSEEALANPDLGMDRAIALMQNLEISKDQSVLSSKIVDHIRPEDRYVTVNLHTDSQSEVDDLKEETFTQVEETISHDGNTVIYFPMNSTNRLNEESVNASLNQIASRVLMTGERILLTGYTDGVGDNLYNIELGDKRAKSIEYYLVSRGISPQRILTVSKGESNTTNQDQHNESNHDRRVELTLYR